MGRRTMNWANQLLVSVSIALALYAELSSAYVVGDFVHFSRKGQYHALRSPWYDQLGRHCPRFGMNSEVVLPLPKPTGYTGSDPYKISFSFGNERYGTPWLFVIGRKGPDVPMIDVNLRYAGGDLLGVNAKVVSMPESYLKEHESIKEEFLDVEKWPKHVLVRYVWEEKSEIDVAGGLFVLFGSGLVLTVFMALHILQSSKEKLARFIQETVVQGTLPGGEAKAD
ncbi:unnamed protein product [Calypogeia fissa]